MPTEHYGPYSFELSNRDKVLFPGSGLTKGDLLSYYERISEVMLRYLRDRPLTQHRFPDGIERDGFYQKQVPEQLPDWVERTTVTIEGGTQEQILCQNLATLAYLAQLACITPHVWLSRAGHDRYPDWLVFDLDPPNDDFDEVRWAAHRCREVFESLELAVFLRLTGSRGVHVVAPLDRSHDFEEVRAFARSLAELLARRYSDRLTVEQRIEKRRNRLYLDTTRNAYGQTIVCPYAVRPIPGAPVAAPITWQELEKSDLDSRFFDTDTVFRLLDEREDPWRGMMRHARSIEKPREHLAGLIEMEQG